MEFYEANRFNPEKHITLSPEEEEELARRGKTPEEIAMRLQMEMEDRAKAKLDEDMKDIAA